MSNINVKDLINENKKLGLVVDYNEFYKTPEAKEYALDKDDEEYYKELCEHGKRRKI